MRKILDRSPLVRHLTKGASYNEDASGDIFGDYEPSSSSESTSPARRQRHGKTKKLTMATQPYVTPRVKEWAKNVYKQTLQAAGPKIAHSREDDMEMKEIKEAKCHPTDPMSIQLWNRQGALRGRTYYGSAKLDGEDYNVSWVLSLSSSST